MKIILAFTLFVVSEAFAAPTLAPDWVSEAASADKSVALMAVQDFETILTAEAMALDKLGTGNMVMKAMPYGFELKEMVTDIAVTKEGLLGLSALKSSNGMEIKWKKKSVPLNLVSSPEIENDLVVESSLQDQELDRLSDTIVDMVRRSGKVRRTRNLKGQVLRALTQINESVSDIHVTSYRNWRVSGLRLDLNFAANGKLWFFSKAGAAFRLRMEWKLNGRKPTTSLAQNLVVNDETHLVSQALKDLDAAFYGIEIPGFEPKKVSLGVGLSVKKKIFTLWKYSAGFVGYLSFVPVKNNLITAPVMFELPGKDQGQSRGNFLMGLQKSLHTVSVFADRAQVDRSTHWHVTEIKTFHDVSKTGFFGLADVTSKGVVEIDLKRK